MSDNNSTFCETFATPPPGLLPPPLAAMHLYNPVMLNNITNAIYGMLLCTALFIFIAYPALLFYIKSLLFSRVPAIVMCLRYITPKADIDSIAMYAVIAPYISKNLIKKIPSMIAKIDFNIVK